MTTGTILPAQINLRSYLETAIENTGSTCSELRGELARLQDIPAKINALEKELQFLHEHLNLIIELESGEWLEGHF